MQFKQKIYTNTKNPVSKMKKIILILMSLMLVATSQFPIEKPIEKIPIQPQKIVFQKCKFISAEYINDNLDPFNSNLKHCKKCGIGAFVGDLGLEKCTNCGIEIGTSNF
jgi:hypothetical protein